MEAARGLRSNSKMGQGAHVCASRQVATVLCALVVPICFFILILFFLFLSYFFLRGVKQPLCFAPSWFVPIFYFILNFSKEI